MTADNTSGLGTAKYFFLMIYCCKKMIGPKLVHFTNYFLSTIHNKILILGYSGSNQIILQSLSCNLVFVLPALAGKTHRDHFVPCCLLMLSVVKRVNIWLYLPHALLDFNQSWAIDATWEPSFVEEVKGHIPRSKVI